MKMTCPHCREEYTFEDKVYLDEANTVVHEKCFEQNQLKVKDSGTFDEIITRYPFFHSLLQH